MDPLRIWNHPARYKGSQSIKQIVRLSWFMCTCAHVAVGSSQAIDYKSQPMKWKLHRRQKGDTKVFSESKTKWCPKNAQSWVVLLSNVHILVSNLPYSIKLSLPLNCRNIIRTSFSDKEIIKLSNSPFIIFLPIKIKQLHLKCEC